MGVSRGGIDGKLLGIVVEKVSQVNFESWALGRDSVSGAYVLAIYKRRPRVCLAWDRGGCVID